VPLHFHPCFDIWPATLPKSFCVEATLTPVERFAFGERFYGFGNFCFQIKTDFLFFDALSTSKVAIHSGGRGHASAF
jgi:hypothetical protein